MVTAPVNIHSVENSRDTHAQRATCACYVVKKTRRMEDVIVAALKAFFHPQREPNLKPIIKMLRDSWSRMAALSEGAVRRKLLQGAAKHPIYTTFTLNCSVNAR